MSETPRRILHLVVEGLPAERLRELESASPNEGSTTEIFPFTEATAREALEKIFAADTVAVWGQT